MPGQRPSLTPASPSSVPSRHGLARRLRLGASGLAIVMAALSVAGCKPGELAADVQTAPPPLAALPLTDVSGPPGANAPPADELPPASPLPIMQVASDRYAYLDRAYELNQAFADAPPDYAFEDEGVSPWVWRSDDGYVRVVEPLSSGERYYYYQPGADRPFLVRDPDYAYGYADGDLVAVYDSRGDVLPEAQMARRADYAARELVRAALLYGLAQRNHRPVARDHWNARRAHIRADYALWSDQAAAEPDWRAYHDQHDQEARAHWAAEAYRRNAEAARFARQVNDQQQAQRATQASRQAAELVRASREPVQTAPPRPDPANDFAARQALQQQQTNERQAALQARQGQFARRQTDAVRQTQDRQAAETQARQQQFAQRQVAQQAQQQQFAERQAAETQARQQQFAQRQAAAAQAGAARADAAGQMNEHRARQAQAGRQEAVQRQAQAHQAEAHQPGPARAAQAAGQAQRQAAQNQVQAQQHQAQAQPAQSHANAQAQQAQAHAAQRGRQPHPGPHAPGPHPPQDDKHDHH